ncbi:alpha-1,3-mannosyl-glycoprotein 4-beta-N-acetylglucosaminyltransferase-like protein MGAT4E [Choloepus didactylus]|uniref:alpha-1,3-mannosyl-glycoprotein 4-beta-N-acetylglucosaminyltransferase-like protein MGAT4E n=1 Tax=Choloepus didactylus TaxID=27675 RepID=UPI00189DA193|nr:alpha-1,3-mannosyl-glycoprotein 4-beta-N-acetylglucosaminyltransferase-like protein MGAT4E [Choloepus didactylus]
MAQTCQQAFSLYLRLDSKLLISTKHNPGKAQAQKRNSGSISGSLLCRTAPGPSIMNHFLWRYIIVAVSLVFLGFIFQENNQEHVEYSLSMEEKRRTVWQLLQEEIKSENKKHLETFKKMRKNYPLLQHTNYKFLAGTIPQEKKLLTVGISSVHRPRGSDLLSTLQSLFHASSEPELKYITVLVHLSDPDPEWLSQTVANISSLFKQHIEAQKLLVIHGFLNDPSLPEDLNNTNHFSSCEALYFRQKADYALLMNFASNLSDYFLMIGDDVHFAPKFVYAIYWALSAWKEIHWVILEFSSLSFSGKVFHTSDLSRLTSFFFLFPKDTPTDLLLSKFRFLLAQDIPIRFSPSIFHHMHNYSVVEDTCFPVDKEKVFDEPDNPLASVITDMMTVGNFFPQYAYILNEEYYATLDPLKGNHLTVILERPQKVTRIVVLTGFHKEGMYQLQQGQVELGYDPMEDSKGCARYTLLGPLVEGNLDQMVFYEDDSVEELSCIRLLVLASQDSWLLVRQIKVWTEPEEEMS